jgi:hypothetical protein
MTSPYPTISTAAAAINFSLFTFAATVKAAGKRSQRIKPPICVVTVSRTTASNAKIQHRQRVFARGRGPRRRFVNDTGEAFT